MLEREPDFQVAGEAEDGDAAIRMTAELAPDVVVLDLQLPGAERPEVLRSLCREDARWRCIVLARLEDSAAVSEAFRAGARGLVQKTSAAKVLIQSIRCVTKGYYWVAGESAEFPAAQLERRLAEQPPGVTFGLTKREMEIVATIVSGFSNREIARKLGISEDTVKHHLTNIFDKVGAYNRLELALFAIHHGLVR
jgi:DNA-binding NarL/FixJ family response regulator